MFLKCAIFGLTGVSFPERGNQEGEFIMHRGSGYPGSNILMNTQELINELNHFDKIYVLDRANECNYSLIKD